MKSQNAWQYDLAGNRTYRQVVAGGKTITTTYNYDANTDRLLSEAHTGPEWAMVINDKPYYAYAGSGGVRYTDSEGKLIGRLAAFTLGLPNEWSQRLLDIVLVLLPMMFLLPVFLRIIHRKARGVRSVMPLLRRCLIILLAYMMLIDPMSLQQLAQGAVQYSNLDARQWQQGNRTIVYAYDNNGSMTSKVTKKSSDSTVLETVTYAYNLQNKLARVVTVAGSTEITEYKYDAEGNRITKSVNGTVTKYLVDNANHTGYSQVFKETTGADSTCYIIGDDVLAQATGNASTAPKYMLQDGHGSTRQLVNSAGTSIILSENYIRPQVMFVQLSD